MTKLVFFSKFIKKASDVLERIPIIKTVYSTSKQIIGGANLMRVGMML